MHAEVEAFHFVLLGGAHADQQVADLENDQGPDDGQHPGYGDGNGLVEHLAGVAVDPAHGLAGVDVVDLLGGEDAGKERAQSSADAVHAEGIQGVVIVELLLDGGDHEEADHAGGRADQDGGEGFDEAGGGSDGDQSGDAAGDRAQHAGLAVVDPLGEHPAERGGGGSEVGGDESAGGERPALTALPALNPNQPTHSRQAPTVLRTRLCGRMDSSG